MESVTPQQTEAEIVEKLAMRRDQCEQLHDKIHDATDGYLPSEDAPEGKKMPEEKFERYNQLSQQHQFAGDEVKRLSGILEGIRVNRSLLEKHGLDAKGAFQAFAHHGVKGYGDQRAMTDDESDFFLAKVPDTNPTFAGETAFRLDSALTRTGAGTDTSGAAAVEEEHVQGVLVENMLQFGGVAKIASVLQTEHGRNLPVPTVDATAQEGVRLAENVAAADLDLPDVGDVTLKDSIYASKVVTISNQLLRDASFDVMRWADMALVTRNARIIEKEMTTGTGTARPEGFVDNLKSALTATDDDAFTWGELLDLCGAIDDGYLMGQAAHGLGSGGMTAYAMNKSTLIKLMQLADTQNRPLYLPMINSMGGMQLFGYPVCKVYGMADVAASAKPIAFGNFSFYVARFIGDTLALKFTDSAYAKKGTTGFLALSEADGRWVQQQDSSSKITCAQVMTMGT